MSDLTASADLAAELIHVARIQAKDMFVALRAFGAAVHEWADEHALDLEAALQMVVDEARDIERFNKGEMNG
jgi:hypothetical protein